MTERQRWYIVTATWIGGRVVVRPTYARSVEEALAVARVLDADAWVVRAVDGSVEAMT